MIYFYINIILININIQMQWIYSLYTEISINNHIFYFILHCFCNSFLSYSIYVHLKLTIIINYYVHSMKMFFLKSLKKYYKFIIYFK